MLIQIAVVTPPKNAASLAHFLPTPPLTPTISVTEHQGTDEAASPSTPSTCAFPLLTSKKNTPASSPSPQTSNANVYARARALLRLSAHGEQNDDATSTPTRLIGRQAERDQLDTFLRCHLPDLYD